MTKNINIRSFLKKYKKPALFCMAGTLLSVEPALAENLEDVFEGISDVEDSGVSVINMIIHALGLMLVAYGVWSYKNLGKNGSAGTGGQASSVIVGIILILLPFFLTVTADQIGADGDNDFSERGTLN